MNRSSLPSLQNAGPNNVVLHPSTTDIPSSFGPKGTVLTQNLPNNYNNQFPHLQSQNNDAKSPTRQLKNQSIIDRYGDMVATRQFTRDYSMGRIVDDPFADLDYLVTQIVRCDEQFCHELPEMHMDAVLVSSHLKYPEIQRDIEVCGAEHGLEAPQCHALFLEALNRVNPILYDLIEQKRRVLSPDPLINYDGLQYMSPFWFTGAGDVWRKVDGRSKRTSIANCQLVKKRLDECLALPENKRTTACVDEYAHAQICAPGIHCPYLRLPMTQCMYNDLVDDYRGIDHCLSTIPKFHRCQDGFVPLDGAL